MPVTGDHLSRMLGRLQIESFADILLHSRIHISIYADRAGYLAVTDRITGRPHPGDVTQGLRIHPRA